MQRILQTFISGLIAALPLALTVFVMGWLVQFIAGYVGPSSQIGQSLSRLGVGVTTSNIASYLVGLAIVALAIYILGLLVETRLGGWLSSLFNRIVKRVPIISSVYGMSRQFTALVDRKGEDNLKSMSAVWCFFGGEAGAAVLAMLPSSKPLRIGDNEYLGILVPTAPVPVGGALIYVPSSWVKPAEGGVEQLMSVYLSMGVTPPRGIKEPESIPVS